MLMLFGKLPDLSQTTPLISVCVCTYHRPQLLTLLLTSLATQELDNFRFEVVVVDNDSAGSARFAVDQARESFPMLDIRYDVEPFQGISFARNRTVRLAKGEYLAFIDDDETASPRWLTSMLVCLLAHDADAVFGPVLPVYPEGTSHWIIKSNYFTRPRYPTGSAICCGDARTGNALINRSWLRQPECFDLKLARSGSEDHEYFKWVESNGGRLIWCDEATVSEVVPESRQSLRFMLERRFRASVTYWRGINQNRSRWKAVVEALAGATGGLIYCLLGLAMLPFGLGKSVRFWVKGMNGFGRVAALSSIRLVGYRGKP